MYFVLPRRHPTVDKVQDVFSQKLDYLRAELLLIKRLEIVKKVCE